MIQFQTDQFKDAVRQFKRHYRISRSVPDVDLLRDILFHYAKLPYENLSKIDNHQTIEDYFGICPEYTERALAALNANLKRDEAPGLWVPKGKTE